MFGAAAAGGGAEEVQHPLAPATAWTHKELLDQEKAAVGFYVSGHPLEDFAEKIGQLNCRTVLELSSAEPDSRVRLAGVVSDFTARNTKKGDRYAFFRLEDLTGAGVKCVLWPEALKTKGKDAANDALLLVVGRLDGSGDSSLTVVCDEVTLLEKARIPLRHYAASAQTGARPTPRALVIELPAETDVPRACEALARTLQGHPGDCAVFFDLPLSADGFKVRLRPARPLSVSSDQRLQDELKAAGFIHRWEELGPPSSFRSEPDYFGGAHVSNAIH
jgi:DNA polymerase III subunit alpha